jgi:hypothetical protein
MLYRFAIFVVCPEGCIIRGELDVERGFDIDEREDVDPGLETETLDVREVTMAKAELAFQVFEIRTVCGLEGGSDGWGVVGANTGDSE